MSATTIPLVRTRPGPTRVTERPVRESRRETDNLYADYCRPKLADLLSSLRLDVAYEKASGNYLFHKDRTGTNLVSVLDLVGGFGAALLGHNNLELTELLFRHLRSDAPMLAQSAVRSGAGRLAAKLNELLPADSKYLVNFSNSGAESVEAALKHAYKVRFDAIRKTYEQLTRETNELFRRIEEEDLEVVLPDPTRDLDKFRDDLDETNLKQFEAFRGAPAVIALKGSFHGKTSGAVKVTFNKTYREGFEGLSAIQSVFIDPDEVERLPEVVNEQRIEFLSPRIEDGKLVLELVPMTKAIALIFEVILGEGGVRLVPESSLATLADLHADLGVPYIIDEVQTGCGRTGAMFAFAKTPLAAIEPDYIALSKALGGGLVKIGATLINERIYDPDFGILHTSTFAEDDVACAVSLATLDMLTRDDGMLMEEIRDKGDYLKGQLAKLAEKYPEVVREVRGRGLMIGLEFRQLGDRSPLFRYAGTQGFLSLLVASYLLHHHRIRVLAPITTLLKGNPGKRRPSVLRIQPSAYITPLAMDRFVAALDEVLRIIDNNNEYLLIAHLVDESPGFVARRAPKRIPVTTPASVRREDFDARVGFIVHPTSVDRLVDHYLPSFRHYPFRARRLTRWWDRLARFLEPDVTHVAYVESDGFVVEANLVAVPFLPAYLARIWGRANSGGDPDRDTRQRLKEIQDKIQDAVTVARELGDDHVPTSVVGLGAFTSIVTDRGMTVNDYEVPITTGNAHTAGLMIQAIGRASEIQGRDLEESVCAVVGATGNIGSVLSTLLSRTCKHVMLVGRRPEALEEVRNACRREGSEAVLTVHTDLAGLEDCDIVAVATNSTDASLITPDLVKKGAVVCCASMPSNLSPEFRDHLDDYFVFDGGLARLPERNVIDFTGLPKNGLSYGCLSETLLVGFDGRNSSFARGSITADQVEETLEMAEMYGFTLGDFSLNQKLHPRTRKEN